MKLNYYPGCSLHGAAIDYQMSVDEVCKKMGIEVSEIDDWNCCGATAAVAEDIKTALFLGARNLAKCAERGKEGDLVVACNACYQRVGITNEKLAKYPEIRKEITQVLEDFGLETEFDKINVKHLLQTFIEDVGLEKIKSHVSKPLKGLKVAPYYGCMLVRPIGFDDPDNPIHLDNLLEALGAEVIPFQRKARCCGGAMISTDTDAAVKLINEILTEADSRGAEVAAVACPICQLNLDAYQARAKKTYGKNYNIPVLYFTQLMGMAFDIDPKKNAMGKGIVPRDNLLKRFA